MPIRTSCGHVVLAFRSSFVLSAYLIGELLLREKEQYQTIDLRAFYIRRILRIWPLYFFALLVGCLLRTLRGSHAPGGRGVGSLRGHARQYCDASMGDGRVHGATLEHLG